MSRPLIAVPIGDPAGIGPEIVVQALADPEVQRACRVLAIGNAQLLERAIELTTSPAALNRVARADEGRFVPGIIDLIDLEQPSAPPPYGEVRADCGAAAYAYIGRAVTLARHGEVDAISTAPINKQSLRLADVAQIGHTEIFAALTGCSDPLTMFEVGRLRIFFFSRHLPLRQACELLSVQGLLDCITRCSAALDRMGLVGPLAVAGLNPHCGDGGLLGDEERDVIEPAVSEARRQGFAVHGPIPADSVFHMARQGRYAAVLALYHDQGHIAAKTLDFARTISITHGLPFLRTSVDHGTAFDIAGQGVASAVSMVEAILAAARYCRPNAPNAPGQGGGQT